MWKGFNFCLHCTFFYCVKWTAAVLFFHDLVMGGVHVSKGGGAFVVVVGRPGMNAGTCFILSIKG